MTSFGRTSYALMLIIVMMMGTGSVHAASESAGVTVDVEVASWVEVDTTGCETNTPATLFGTVIPGLLYKSGASCNVSFNSSNNDAMLRINRGGLIGGMRRKTLNFPEVAGTQYSLYGTDIRGANDAIAVGERGYVITTSDGAANWVVRNSGVGATHLLDVDYGDDHVWISGVNGLIRKSIDGGVNWSGQTSGTTNDLNGVAAADNSKVWAVGEAGIIRHSPDGTNWVGQTSPTGQWLSGVDEFDNQTLYAVGNGGTVIKTTDGGATPWADVSLGLPIDLGTVHVVDALTVFAGGEATAACGALCGRIVYTTDGGNNWNVTIAPIGADIEGIWVENTTRVWATAGPYAMLSTDSGANFTPILVMRHTQLRQIIGFSGTNIYAIGRNRIVARTTDQGVAWFDRNQSESGRGAYGIARFEDRDTIYAVGELGMVRKSTDRGATWTTQTDAMLGTAMSVANAYSENNVVAVGVNGQIATSDDGAATWTARNSGTALDLESIVAASKTTMWAVGNGGTILKSTNGGTSWIAQVSGTAVDLNRVEALDEQTALIVGEGGTILKTINGGDTWNPMPSGTGTGLYDISAATDQVLYVAANSNLVLKSIDGGASWSSLNPGLSATYTSISAPLEDVVYAYGLNNRRAFSEDGGITWTTGSGGAVSSMDILALSPVEYLVADRTGTIRKVGPDTTANGWIDDYVKNTTDWDQGTSAYGICLENTVPAGRNDWVQSASCVQDDDAATWYGVPNLATKVAHTNAIGEAVDLTFWFGMRAGDSQIPGNYYATVVFDAVAPNL